MKLALIPPIDLLDWTCETDFQLMLPHLIGDERYDYTYAAHCEDPEQYVILDNGAAEGEEIAMYRLIEIAQKYGVDEVVIPDTIGDMLDTQEKAEYFFDIWFADKWWGKPDRPQLMYVIQGKTLDELKQSAAYALDDLRVDVIGIPRHVLTSLNQGNGNANSRYFMTQWIATKPNPKPVHLLGGNPKYPCELRSYPWPKIVRSTDTSSPFNFSYENKVLRVGNVVKRPEGYFDLPWDAFQPDKLHQNVEYLLKWTGAERA